MREERHYSSRYVLDGIFSFVFHYWCIWVDNWVHAVVALARPSSIKNAPMQQMTVRFRAVLNYLA